jgi:hypothetical protein
LIEDKRLGEICLTDFEWEGKFGKMRVNRAKTFNVEKERVFSIFWGMKWSIESVIPPLQEG